MIMAIRGYGDPVLRTKAQEIGDNSPEIQALIDDMLETMDRANGAGLAAPQVGRDVRLFVADLTQAWEALTEEERTEIPPQPMVCINPRIVHKSEETTLFNEGCLSIPGLVEEIERPAKVTLRYLDREFQTHEIDGVSYTASVLQHEFDHLNGVLYIDYLSEDRRRELRRDLLEIERGEIRPEYPMRFATGREAREST